MDCDFNVKEVREVSDLKELVVGEVTCNLDNEHKNYYCSVSRNMWVIAELIEESINTSNFSELTQAKLECLKHDLLAMIKNEPVNLKPYVSAQLERYYKCVEKHVRKNNEAKAKSAVSCEVESKSVVSCEAEAESKECVPEYLMNVIKNTGLHDLSTLRMLKKQKEIERPDTSEQERDYATKVFLCHVHRIITKAMSEDKLFFNSSIRIKFNAIHNCLNPDLETSVILGALRSLGFSVRIAHDYVEVDSSNKRYGVVSYLVIENLWE
jgi:hypothetical protein